MRRRRQDFAKHWFTALVVVVLMVAFSFQATLSGEEKEKKHLLQLAPQKKGEYALGEDNTMYLYNGREWEEVEGKGHKFIKAYNGMFHHNGKRWEKVITIPSTKPDGFRIGFGPNGGYSSWALGDFGLSKEYYENLNSIPGYSASTSDLSGSPVFNTFPAVRSSKIGRTRTQHPQANWT
jgi:hypothetical protein